jgi:hypothetical protein
MRVESLCTDESGACMKPDFGVLFAVLNAPLIPVILCRPQTTGTMSLTVFVLRTALTGCTLDGSKTPKGLHVLEGVTADFQPNDIWARLNVAHTMCALTYH